MNRVELKNIFSEKSENVLIKLDPKLSVHDNAAKYFSKYKNIEKMKTDIVSKKDTYSEELKYWKNIYDDSKKFDSLKKVEQLKQVLIQKGVLNRGDSSGRSTKLDKTAFNRLILESKWEILIGKNAKNNDLLTFKFAHKYDLWLHAQGVPGSHVIIYLSDKNIEPPMAVIEKAAGIAAYFSAAKTSSTVPVNYTKVRYVRKPRKAQPGTVLISHSKTIFVEPKKYL
jgi:predicted ribosome quality control (RQC) complex YloA/Tae2 family protein